ncbi:uncharacterized protein PV09_06358 [Verruconis gallopava]|uniref:Zn(2)-C6 fungal-type domain-containing protein n=1 Tax=Verruconis gallopava TaxID=253628 RepID=A0A0D1YN74_9PEZI|nr:uncharacterized protein PV09_06358 [Verruconis gallopava]KIW02202.1 hypothetical protein PV09_06358 [Verruconis gallopava]
MTDHKTSRSRSKAACQFCRARKLKCDNLEPTCSACKARNIRCEYVIRAPAPRPSNAAIHALQNEVARLRRLLEQANVKIEDGFDHDGDAGTVDGSPRPSSSSHAQALTSPVYSDTTHSVRRPSEAEQMFDPQLQSMDGSGRIKQSAYTHHYPPDHSSPRWQESRHIDPVTSNLDETTKSALRSQLVAFSARQRQIEALPLSSQSYDYDGWDADLVNHLLNIHWNRQHHNLLIIYRPLFMRDWASGGPYFSKLLLNAILFASAKFSPRDELRKSPELAHTAGFAFRERFKTLLGAEMDDSKITTIQALITLASSLFAIETSAKSTAWLYSGIAFRMIIDLGLNVDGVELLKHNKISPEELECRRRVFWGAFVFDKIHSMYYGRPVTLQESSVQVPIEFLDDYEELEQWYPLEALNTVSADYPLPSHRGGPSYSVTTFSAHCRISVILGRILTEFYAENVYCHRAHVATTQQPNQVHTMEVLDELLARFNNELKDEIRYEPWATGEPVNLNTVPTPTVLSMLCMYHLCVILLHRPFFTRGHLYDENEAPQSLMKCAVTAMRVSHLVTIYKHAFTGRRMPYFIAYSSYVAVAILMRINAFLEAGSNVHKCLQHGLNVLADSERVNAGLKRAGYVISKLLFAVARTGPNPFPPSDTMPPPWGEVLTDNVHLDQNIIPKIIATFSATSPDAAAEQSQLEVHPNEPGLGGHRQDSAASGKGSWDIDSDGTAAQLLTSMRTNTPAHSAVATPKPHPLPLPETPAPFPDIVFGLHSDEAFLQSWPDFNSDLEAMLWMPGLITNGPPPAS